MYAICPKTHLELIMPLEGGEVTNPGSEGQIGADKEPEQELRASQTGLCRHLGAGMGTWVPLWPP